EGACCRAVPRQRVSSLLQGEELFFFSSRRRHTRSVSAFLLNRSSDLTTNITLTLADDRLEAFYDNPNALRDYFRDIGRMVLAAEGRKANDSHADCRSEERRVGKERRHERAADPYMKK